MIQATYRLYKGHLDKQFLQICHIDNEAVFHIAFDHPLIGGIDVVHVNELDIRDNFMLGAKIEHLLRFAYSSNE